MITERYVWPNIKKQITSWARNCIPCQLAKVTRHTKSPIQRFPDTSSRLAHVHIDIVGPRPTSEGFNNVFTCIDRYTRSPEAIPIKDTTAETLALVKGWIAIFGTPATITTDRGRNFESRLFNRLMESIGSDRIRPYQDRSIPSRSKRNDRALPSPVKELTQVRIETRRMDTKSTANIIRNPHTSKRGYFFLTSRGPLRPTIKPARRSNGTRTDRETCHGPQ